MTFRKFLSISLYATLGCLIVLPSCKNKRVNKTYPGFAVNSDIKDEVEKNIKDLGQMTPGALHVEMFENDHPIDSTGDTSLQLPLLAIANIGRDTIHITGFCGFTAAIGFYLDLYKEQSVLTCLVKTDADIYKLNESDTTFTFGLSVPCTKTNVILSALPQYKSGELIEGKIELTSRDFYENDNGTLKRYSIKMTAYFKAKVLKL